jgi:hypothetical protein
MTNDNFCFYMQNRLIQTSQTGGQWYSDTFPLVFPGASMHCQGIAFPRSHYIDLTLAEDKIYSILNEKQMIIL